MLKMILMAGSCLLLFSWGSSYKIVTTQVDRWEEVGEEDPKRRMLELMRKLGIKFERVVFEQMLKETGNLSSTIYRENHNLFGMKFNKRGMAKGTKRGHALYGNTAESLLDYKLWQDRWSYRIKNCRTEEEYLQFLDNLDGRGLRYAEDPNYTADLRKRLSL